jgi:TolA-binding protein
MIKKVGIVFSSIVLLASCGGNKEQENHEAPKNDTVVVNSKDCGYLLQQAKKMDSILMKANTVNKQVADNAINAFNNYASLCQNDSLAPVFLVKAGQVAQSIGNFRQAQILLQKCVNDFPKFNNRGAALFLLAQLYDDVAMLNNESEAKTIYTQIIKEYPNTAWERDSKISLSNLGKTDEQLVQEFLKKNK